MVFDPILINSLKYYLYNSLIILVFINLFFKIRNNFVLINICSNRKYDLIKIS